jgi:hypothetical protein
LTQDASSKFRSAFPARKHTIFSPFRKLVQKNKTRKLMKTIFRWKS